MAIKLKAKETLFSIGDYAGQYRYVLSAELYGKLSESKVVQEAALRSGVSRGVMQACWDAAGEVIKAWATEGHSVALPGLGTMRFSVTAKSVASVDQVASSLIKRRRVIFTPNTDIKKELRDASILITCYDRNGQVVKNVTSDDDGDIEEDNSGSTEDTTGSTESGTTSGTESGSTDNSGSGDSGSSNSGSGDSGGDGGDDDDVMA